MRHFALAAVLAVFAQGALAVPPEQSPRPQIRPMIDVAAAPGVLRPLPRLFPPRTEVARAAVLPVAVGAVANAAEAQLRPAIRPAGHVVTLLSSIRPALRPARGTETVQLVAAVRVPPATAPVTGRKTKGLCGDPAIVGKTIPPILSKVKGCGLRDGVSVISVAGVALTQPATIDCPTALALKDWVENGVKPAVGNEGGGIAALQVAASYSCRPRNNQRGAKISEHGGGRAIDISGVILANGTVFSVLKGWGTKAAGPTLASMRKTACGPFNTVLGPGSDRFHSDHLHLDTARGRGAYCH